KSLELLGFSMISATTDSITVTVPSHRHDIFEDIDLVEEVLRLRGTDAIVEVPLPIKPVPATPPTVRHILSTTLVNLGYVETINFSFLDHETAVLFGDKKHLIHLKNPITADLTTMRTSLMPSLLKVASDNQKRAMETIPLFEVANVYGSHVKDHQTLHCAALWAGKNHPHHWHHKKDDVTFFDIKDHMMTVLEAFGVKESNLQLTTDSLPSYYHPTRAAVIKQGNRILGSIGQLHPKVLKHMDVHGAVCGFDINVSLLPPQKQKRTGVKDLSPYQPVEKDFAFLVNKDFEAGKLPQILMQKLTRQSAFPKYVTLERADIFDIFPMEGQKSIALALRFQPEQATLSETDLDHIMTTVINLIQKETGGTLRQ
ncbi:MAG: hypothetical protein K2X98_01385, partial [Alphaproteobacteria bacterium]|nr:hypothetical protein [Alphaproteobacteria bacterium]